MSDLYMLLEKIPPVRSALHIAVAENLAKVCRPKGQGAIAVNFKIGSGG
jgi:hypothetical protein